MKIAELLESLKITENSDIVNGKRPLYRHHVDGVDYICVTPKLSEHRKKSLYVGIAINPDITSSDYVVCAHVKSAIMILLDELKTDNGQQIANDISIPQAVLDFAA